MAGISSKAAGKLENKKNKFQGQEYNDDLGADIYEFKWRMHDPQMGRFWQVDPLADKYTYNSTYAFAENKLGKGVELEGLELGPFPWMLLETNNVIARGSIVEDIVKTSSEVGSKTEQHHLLPRQLKGDPVAEQAREGGFKYEGQENKMGVEKFRKSTGEGRHGNHPDYTSEVSKRMSDFQKDNPNATPKEAAEFAKNLAKELRETIQNNPGTKINDLFKAPSDATKANIFIPLDSKTLKQNAEDNKVKLQQEKERQWAERNGKVIN
jgi:RHS repeat-associated protein